MIMKIIIIIIIIIIINNELILKFEFKIFFNLTQFNFTTRLETAPSQSNKKTQRKTPHDERD